jgi:hypothetical protein
MADLKAIVLVAVAKEDFEMFDKLAKAMMFAKNPAKKLQIKAVRQFVLDQFQKFQQESVWFSELQNDIENNIYHPKLLRRHSI